MKPHFILIAADKLSFYLKRKVFVLLLFLFHASFLFAQIEATTVDGRKVILYPNGTWIFKTNAPSNKSLLVNRLEIPEAKFNNEVINHIGYALSYNEEHEQANWVAYELTQEEIKRTHERKNNFISDPGVTTGTATDFDYYKSGYHKGHLAPAADMGWSEGTMSESFYYSNMSPQLPSFNTGIWKKLEGKVREWAVENKAVYVITGPVLREGLTSIGPNKVSVPKYFYKVILDYMAPGIKGIAFIVPNAKSNEPLIRFAVTIDSVEQVTGLNFFPLLPNDQEERIERTLDLKAWNWNATSTAKGTLTNKKGLNKKTKTSSLSNVKYSSQPVQCTVAGISGKRCARMTGNINGKCWQHE